MKYSELFENGIGDDSFESKQSEILHMQNKILAAKHKLGLVVDKFGPLVDAGVIIPHTTWQSLPTKDYYVFIQGTGGPEMNYVKYYARLFPGADSKSVSVPPMVRKIQDELLKIPQQIKTAKERIRELTVKGMSFCFTGFRDEEAEQRIRQLGGEIKASVVQGLDFLVAKDPTSTSGKAQKARAQGTKVISQAQLANMLRD